MSLCAYRIKLNPLLTQQIKGFFIQRYAAVIHAAFLSRNARAVNHFQSAVAQKLVCALQNVGNKHPAELTSCITVVGQLVRKLNLLKIVAEQRNSSRNLLHIKLIVLVIVHLFYFFLGIRLLWRHAK